LLLVAYAGCRFAGCRLPVALRPSPRAGCAANAAVESMNSLGGRIYGVVRRQFREGGWHSPLFAGAGHCEDTQFATIYPLFWSHDIRGRPPHGKAHRPRVTPSSRSAARLLGDLHRDYRVAA